jgi:aryl-alcohol dehydrogenase-like predicted oxidoreductase
LALLELAWDLGINLLDTAPAYGESEERLGRLLRQCRRDWVIVTKVGEEFRRWGFALRFFRRRDPRQRGAQPAAVGRGERWMRC